VGGVTPSLALVAVRHANQANATTGVIRQPAYQHDDCPSFHMRSASGSSLPGQAR
jgi:hypothetical protein